MKEWSGGFPNNLPSGASEENTPAQDPGAAGYVCYVDDSKTSAYVTRKILKDHGFQVDHFTSAEPAIVSLLQKDYDLLVTDLTLESGGMDGDELLRFLRRSGHPRKKAMPVVLITGHTDKDTLLNLYESGANAVLTKPIAGDALLDKLRSLIPEKPRDWRPNNGSVRETRSMPTPRPTVPAGQARSNAAQRILMQQAAFRKHLGAEAKPAPAESRPRPMPKAPPVRPLRGGMESATAGTAPSDRIPPNPFAEATTPTAATNGRSIGQALGGAVKSAMDAARQKLGDKSGRGEDATNAPRASDAAQLIARLRSQKKKVADTGADRDIPVLQESPVQAPPKAPPVTAETPAAPEREPFFFDEAPAAQAPTPETEPAPAAEAAPAPAVSDAPAAEATGAEDSAHTADDTPVVADTDIDQLFAGLVPGAGQAAREQGAEAGTADEGGVDDDRRMITAFDVGTDLVNMQDSFYEDSRYNPIRLNADGLLRLIMEYKIIIAAIILAALLIVSNFGSVLTGQGTVQVETVRVGLGSIHQSLTVPGKVVSNLKVEVSTSSPGKIVSVNVKEGQKVEKGDVLAEIENEQAMSDVKRAEGNLQSAREETQLADKTWKRMRHAFSLGAVSRFAVEEAEAALKTAKARQAVAMEEVRSSRLALKKLTVNAPFTGTVTARHAQLGQWVSPAEPLFTLVDMSKREIELKVDTADSNLIRTGQEVVLSSGAHQGKQWTENVIRVAPATSSRDMTNTVSVFVSLGNGAPDLRIGQQVDAEIRHSSSSNIIKLPIEALVSRNGATWVAVVQDGRVHFSPVVIGMEDFTHVEVLEGVQPRQEVIIPRDANTLQEGDLVRVMATRTVE